jgi:hypothetical protein
MLHKKGNEKGSVADIDLRQGAEVAPGIDRRFAAIQNRRGLIVS